MVMTVGEAIKQFRPVKIEVRAGKGLKIVANILTKEGATHADLIAEKHVKLVSMINSYLIVEGV